MPVCDCAVCDGVAGADASIGWLAVTGDGAERLRCVACFGFGVPGAALGDQYRATEQQRLCMTTGRTWRVRSASSNRASTTACAATLAITLSRLRLAAAIGSSGLGPSPQCSYLTLLPARRPPPLLRRAPLRK